MDDRTHQLDLAILDSLESDELAPLCWGLVDGGFGDDELLDRLDQLADALNDPRTAEDIRASLIDKALLVFAQGPVGQVWRTRMAESVRLTVRLRQLFPSHLKGRGWRTAPALVSDFRFVARSRRFPSRNVQVEDFLAIALDGERNDKIRNALRALTDPASGVATYSSFQVRAAANILRNVDSPTSTLVAAGTGSGKTKAFYLPAFAKLVSLKDADAWTKLMAIYPRTELLKDQLQKALAEARVLRARTGTQLTVGAFYGDTPLYSNEEPSFWTKKGGRRICPFLSCPRCGCEMYWFRDGSVGALQCTECPEQVLPNELLISRFQMQNRPPDVLLSTTETLNRQLSNDYCRHVFGVGQTRARSPRFLLLDEIHTFTGTTGAQTALLLRRWRHVVGYPVHTVGLSATIVDGAPFLAELAGIPVANVTVVEASDDEMIESGKEYLIALRGDPASGAALLSTTIQTSMLMRRTLDRPNRPKSDGAYGSKLFVFTDDLDVTNRLLHFLRNAEGLTDKGKVDSKKPDGSLANLRNHLLPDYKQRARDGQAWDLCRDIGHDLTPAQKIVVERTSSQDPGLERGADMVVATASLEVGLDDDSVGAVIQHKAPRDAAGFLQRRGRAGRQALMRPWTAVVLSDYGRDRQAFQGWDTLFEPVLRPSRLPVRNRHILRIQATFSLIDWLAQRLRDGGAAKGYMWSDLGGPAGGNSGRRVRVTEELVRLLEDEITQRNYCEFVAQALQLSNDEVSRIMWDPPRAVLASVVPTLLRRLESGWRRSAPGGATTDLNTKEPLPDYVPSALFADLLLPEVSVHMPEFNGKVDVETMGALQALKEFAPGRVTHRFAVGHTHDRLWIPPHDGDIPVDDYVESDPLTYLPTLGGESLRVYRPLTMRPINPPNNIANSSNARLTWLSDFHPIGRVETREPPPGGGWNSILQRFDFHLHQTGGRLVVHRVATGSNATVTESRETRRVTTRFVDSHGPVGLGVRMEVDAVRVAIKDPADWMATYHRDPVRSRGLRAAWFRETICRDDDLTAISSIFQRNWLAELACALVIDRSAATGDLREGSRTLGDPNVDKLLDEILTVVFQSIDPTSVTGDDAPDDELNVTKLHRELLVLAAEPAARKALRIAGEQLVDPSGIAFEEWLRDRFAATVAGAIVTAANLMDEEIVGHDLVVDGSDWHDGTATLTFCETHPGGIGVVERLFACLQQDPKRFWRTVATAVGPSDAEEIDARMTRIVNLACDVPAVAERFERLRNSPSNQDRKTNWKRLVSSLAEHGEVLSVGVNVALSLRILRAGTTDRTDTLLRDLLKSWSEIEERLGLELDQRVFAYLASSDSTLDDSLAFEAVGGERDRTWRFNSILSLLWQRGSTLREQPLRLWSPFDGLGEPERTLVAERLEHHLRGIDVNQAGVADIAAGELADAGAVEILAPKSDLRLKQVLLESLARPVEVGVLELYPRVVGAHRRAHGLAIELEIAEVLG